MDQTHAQRSAPASASRAYQFHPARAAIVDLFDLYLGVITSSYTFFLSSALFRKISISQDFFFFFILQRSSRQKPDDSVREPP